MLQIFEVSVSPSCDGKQFAQTEPMQGKALKVQQCMWSRNVLEPKGRDQFTNTDVAKDAVNLFRYVRKGRNFIHGHQLI